MMIEIRLYYSVDRCTCQSPWEKWSNKTIMDVCFFGVPCKNVYNCIIVCPFLTSLDIVASHVHMKLKCHNNSNRVVVIKIDLHGACQIHEVILKSLSTVSIIPKGRVEEASKVANMVDLDPCEKEATMGDKLCLSIGIKAKLLRSFLDGDFKNV